MFLKFLSLGIVISLFIQTSPNEEMLSIVHTFYRDIFKDLKGSMLIDDRKMEKISRRN